MLIHSSTRLDLIGSGLHCLLSWLLFIVLVNFHLASSYCIAVQCFDPGIVSN